MFERGLHHKKQFTAAKALQEAETTIDIQERMNEQPRQKGGVGYRDPTKHWKPTTRKKITEHILNVDCAAMLQKLQQLQMQGAWAAWSETMYQDFSWHRLISEGNDKIMEFAIKAATNVLPTRDNLRRWGNSVIQPACPLWGAPATLRHILTGCSTTLRQGRYTW